MYKNVKIFSDICAHSSGNLYYYPEYIFRTHNLKFTNELYHNLTRKIAWEAVFRIRLSKNRGWVDSNGARYNLDTAPHKFYDNNF